MRQLLSCLVLLQLAAAAGAAEIRLEVKHRSAATVYLAGGSADGLAVGDRLSVVSKGSAIGELEVVFLAEHSASCKVLSESRPIQAGDAAVAQRPDAAKPGATPEITLQPVAPAPSGPAPSYAAAAGTPRPVPWARARGSLSLGWNKLWDDTPNQYDFEQRTARLDLGLWEIGGQPLQLNVRARSRQDLRARQMGFENIPTDERRDRFYEAALRYEPPNGRMAVEAGRIGVANLGLGYLDGAVAELRLVQTLRLGGFFGNRADVEQVPGFQQGRKYGGYLRLAGGGRYWPGRYDALGFFVRELAGSEVSREYVGFQGRFASKSFYFSQWAELDLLRGWRTSADGSTQQLSNLSLSASYKVKPGGSFAVSYDQRRNYRTAETRSIPDALFDTFLHQGFRGSVDVARANGIGVNGFFGVRLSDQKTKTAYSYGGSLRHPNLFGAQLSGGLDASGFTNGTTKGYQGNVRLGRMTRSVMASASYGVSSYTLTTTTVLPNPASTSGARRLNQWLRLSARGDFSKGAWLYGEFEYAHGDDVKGPRGALELGYRF
jgi:hypothetical protein